MSKKESFIQCRVNVEEKSRIKANADKFGFRKMSAFIRDAALNYSPVNAKQKSEIKCDK